MTEYAHLKSEQSARVGFRDNLLYATLASMAGVLAATVGFADSARFLLLLPAASVVLGWTYLVNDEKISAIGRYIRLTLAPELARVTGEGTAVFQWELEHRRDSRRRSRKLIQLAVDLGTFCVAPLVALIFYGLRGPYDVALIFVAVAELAAVLVLASQIIRYADLTQ